MIFLVYIIFFILSAQFHESLTGDYGSCSNQNLLKPPRMSEQKIQPTPQALHFSDTQTEPSDLTTRILVPQDLYQQPYPDKNIEYKKHYDRCLKCKLCTIFIGFSAVLGIVTNIVAR